MMTVVKIVRAGVLAGAALVAAASPAGASTVLANQKYQWFWWLAPILGVAAVVTMVALWGGYIVRVLFPKYRGRKVKE